MAGTALLFISGCRQEDKAPAPRQEVTQAGEVEEEGRQRHRATQIRTFSQEAKPSGTPRSFRPAGGGANGQDSTAGTSRMLSGQVTDMAGDPIAGAHVEVLSPPYQALSAASKDDGEFSFSRFPDTTVTLRATAANYRPLEKSSGPGRDRVSFVLQKRQTVTLHALVIDDQTSQPIADAKVTAIEGALGEPRQKSPGTFEIPVEAGTSVRFKVEAPGFLALDTGRLRLPAEDQVIQMLMPLGKGGTIRGQVVERGIDKQPMAGVRVQVFPRDEQGKPLAGEPLAAATTNGEGYFDISLVPSGTWAVLARSEAPVTTASKVVSVGTAQVADAGVIELGEAQFGAIAGRVVRLPQRKGVEGLEVLLRRMSGQRTTTQTSADGTFQFDSIASGQMGVYVPEYHLYTWITFIEGEPTKKVELYVGAGRLEGKVLRNGQPVLADCKIAQAGQSCDQTKRTAPDGSFLFDGLAPGQWNVNIVPKAFPHLGREFPVTILEEGPTQKTFNLPNGNLVGLIVDANKEPVPGATAAVSWLPKGQASTRLEAVSDSEGRFTIRDLDAGEFTVVANHPEKGVGTTKGVLVPDQGDSTPCTVVLTSTGGTLVSTALNFQTGAPVPEAWCHLYPADGGFYKHNAKRGPDGVLTIPQVPPGKYRTQVSFFSLSVEEQEVEIRDGETVQIHDVLHPSGAINVSVNDRDGSPVPGAEVTIRPETAQSIENQRTALTDEKGAATVRGLMVGRYSVSVRAQGKGSASGVVGVIVSGVSVLQLALK